MSIDAIYRGLETDRDLILRRSEYGITFPVPSVVSA